MTREDVKRYSYWARIHLGMSRAEFGTYTLGEFCSLVELWKAKQRREDIQTARICHTVASSMGAKLANGAVIPFEYFMPGYRPPRQKKEPKLFDQFMQTIAALGLPVQDLRKQKHGKK